MERNDKKKQVKMKQAQDTRQTITKQKKKRSQIIY